MPLDPHIHELLLILERAEGTQQEWVSIDDIRHIPESCIASAVRENWVKQKGFGNLRQFKILGAGYSALGHNAEQVIKMLNGDNIESLDAPAAGRAAIRNLIQPLGEPVVFQVEEPAPAANVKTCCEPGCNEPRHLKYNRCKAHQQAIWRENQAVQRGAISPNRRKRSTPKTEPHAPIVEPPVDDEDTQPDFIPVQITVADTPPRRIRGCSNFDSRPRPCSRPAADLEGGLA